MEKNEIKRGSLWTLQDALLLAEEEMGAANLEDIIGSIAGKIDAIKETIDIMEMDAKRWADYAAEMTKKKKAAENAAERLRRYVTDSLVAHGTSFELGHKWKVQVTSHKKVTVDRDPTVDDLFELSDLGVIKASYSWDKKALANELERNNESVLKLARIETTNSVKFSANERKQK